MIGTLDRARTLPHPVSGPTNEQLIGREPETLTITEQFERLVAGEGGVLYLTGDAGVGKSALLDFAAREGTARGLQVLRCTGVEFDPELTYLGLTQLLLPLQDQVEALAPGYRDALGVSLGLTRGTGSVPDRLLVCNAVLALLEHVAAAAPVLLVVDDVAWLDRASAVVLGFVARSLADTRIAFVCASRPGNEPWRWLDAAPIRLGPLTPHAAHALVRAQFPQLTAALRRRVVEEGEGFPLALLEFAAAAATAAAGQRTSLHPAPSVLPLSGRLRSMFAERIAALPAATRDLLLLAVLEGAGDLGVLRVTAGSDAVLDQLAPAETGGLVRVHEGLRQVAFLHPLVRAAVVDASTAAERRRAHRKLAGAVPEGAEQRAWHLAHATIGPDEAVAALVEDAARGILRRGDAIGAVHALVRAADLSEDQAGRSRRLASAAYLGCRVNGELRSAQLLLDDARGDGDAVGAPLPLAVAAASVLFYGEFNSDSDATSRLLVAAIDDAFARGNPDERTMFDALETLALICGFFGHAEAWATLARSVPRVGASAPLDLRMRAATADPATLDRSLLGELDRAIAGLERSIDLSEIIRVGIVSIYVDRLPACEPALRRVAEDGELSGAVTSAVHARWMLGYSAFWRGDWDAAQGHFDAGLALCHAHELQGLTWPGLAGYGLIAAGRGDRETAHACADATSAWAKPRGARGAEVYACNVRALAALGDGDFESAFQAAAAIAPPGDLTFNRDNGMWTMLDLVEAAVRSGRGDQARAHVAAMRQADLPSISSRLALHTAAGEALTAPEDDADAIFERALATPGADGWTFDHARVRLMYGAYLRRRRASRRAREQLQSALTVFHRLGAAPWAARAERELAATGEHRRRSDDPAAPVLSSQELVIAQLAAAGLSNKEIGTRLFLSHRTVSSHLYRIFPRLEITSRAMLRDALLRLERGPA